MITEEQRQSIIDDINKHVSPYYALYVQNEVFSATSGEGWTVVPHKVINIKNSLYSALNEEIDEVHFESTTVTDVPHSESRIVKLGDTLLYKDNINCVVNDGLNPKLVELIYNLYEAVYMNDITTIFILLRQISLEKKNQVARNMLQYKKSQDITTIKPFKM